MHECNARPSCPSPGGPTKRNKGNYDNNMLMYANQKRQVLLRAHVATVWRKLLLISILKQIFPRAPRIFSFWLSCRFTLIEGRGVIILCARHFYCRSSAVWPTILGGPDTKWRPVTEHVNADSLSLCKIDGTKNRERLQNALPFRQLYAPPLVSTTKTEHSVCSAVGIEGSTSNIFH